MHLVFLNQYYPPDAAPTGVMLQAVAEELARQGHVVTVICAAGSGYAGGGGTSNIEHPTSNVEGGDEESITAKARSGMVDLGSRGASDELERGIHSAVGYQPSTCDSQLSFPHIMRLRASRFGRGTFAGKLVDYASYYGGVIWKLLWLEPRPDRVIALTTPPYISLVARALSKVRGGDHAHWVMDLYPDVMAAHGMLGEGGRAYRFLKWLSRWGMGGERCAAVVTLGPDMAGRVGNLMGSLNIVGGDEDGEILTAEARKSQRDAKGVGTSNIERSTSNIEGDGNEESITAKARRSPRGAEGEGTSNIERSTSNIEGDEDGDIFTHEARRSQGDAEGVGEGSTGILPVISKNPPCSIQWVPLWGVEGDTGVLLGISEGVKGRDAPSTVWSETLQLPDCSGESATVAVDAGAGEGVGGVAARRGEHGLLRDAAATELRAARGWRDDELVVMYSGNMGLGHRFGEILEVAGMLEGGMGVPPVDSDEEAEGKKGQDVPSTDCCGTLPLSGEGRSGSVGVSPTLGMERSTGVPPVDFGEMANGQDDPSTITLGRGGNTATCIRIVFYGGGKRRGEVESFVTAHPGSPVELHDYVPAVELSGHLRSADVHLVSLEPAWTGTMVPSKLQGIFAVGRPVVFVGSAGSSIGSWVAESGGGWVVAAGDVGALRAALEEARDPAVRAARGAAALAFAKRHFDKRTNVRRVARIVSRGRA